MPVKCMDTEGMWRQSSWGLEISGKKKNKREYENRKYVHSSDEVSVK